MLDWIFENWDDFTFIVAYVIIIVLLIMELISMHTEKKLNRKIEELEHDIAERDVTLKDKEDEIFVLKCKTALDKNEENINAV